MCPLTTLPTPPLFSLFYSFLNFFLEESIRWVWWILWLILMENSSPLFAKRSKGPYFLRYDLCLTVLNFWGGDLVLNWKLISSPSAILHMKNGKTLKEGFRTNALLRKSGRGVYVISLLLSQERKRLLYVAVMRKKKILKLEKVLHYYYIFMASRRNQIIYIQYFIFLLDMQ